MLDISDKVIFNALREHLKPATLSQLIVDITNEALQRAETRAMIIDTLKLTPTPQQAIVRPYNLTPETLRKVYPDASISVIPLILKYAPLYGVITKKQMCAFLSTVIIESNGFKAKRESFNYRPARLQAVFSKRIKSIAHAQELLSKGQPAVANFLYNGRYGNLPNSNDGWTYRGGGLIQLTFRHNYAAAGRRLGIELEKHPELIEQLDVSVLAAFDFWKNKGLNQAAEGINLYSNGWQLNTLNSKGKETNQVKMNTGIVNVREIVNGGTNGLEEVADMFQKCMKNM